MTVRQRVKMSVRSGEWAAVAHKRGRRVVCEVARCLREIGGSVS
jgi:hypothetical protein